MSGTDDERFAEIVAGFGQDTDQPVPPWPVSEDLGDDPPVEDEPVSQPFRPVPEEDLPAWLEPDALEDDGHYVPPPPPRIPRPRPRTIFAVAMLLLGLAVLFMPFQIGVDDGAGWMLTGLALTTGGAGLLVWWMRDAPPTDSGPDNGAVV